MSNNTFGINSWLNRTSILTFPVPNVMPEINKTSDKSFPFFLGQGSGHEKQKNKKTICNQKFIFIIEYLYTCIISFSIHIHFILYLLALIDQQ